MNIPAFKNWAAPALAALAVTACSAGGAPTATIPPPAAKATRQPALTLMPVVTDMPNAAGVFPILVGFRVLGGVKDGQWLDAPTTASLVPREISFRMFRGSNLATELTGTITMTDNYICISPSKIYIVEVNNNWK